MLTADFFDRDAQLVAQELLGKVIKVKCLDTWLAASIIETEAYYLEDKASHSSLGFTKKRQALFMPAGTIYMYYARGKDSLNVSAKGEGNAVLIKSGFPYGDAKNFSAMINIMRGNQAENGAVSVRPIEKLCAGQTLLCSALSLKVKDWDGKQFDKKRFYIEDLGYRPEKIIQTTRLGIPEGRDGHLPYRFIDFSKAKFCSKYGNFPATLTT